MTSLGCSGVVVGGAVREGLVMCSKLFQIVWGGLKDSNFNETRA